MRAPLGVPSRDAGPTKARVRYDDYRVRNDRQGPGGEVRYEPASTRRVCQLTGDYDPEGLPHINDTAEWGVVGTDLGIPVEHQGRLYVLFGDVAEFDDADPVAYTTDTDPEPHGFRLTPILRGGPGTSFRPFRVRGLTNAGYLGRNETPTGGFSYDGRLYAFVVTGDDEPLSSLVSSADPASDFDLHHHLSDADGKFWQIAPWVIGNADWPGLPSKVGDGVLLWGQAGCGVHLAWMGLRPGRGPSAHPRYYAGPGVPWAQRESDAVPLFSVPSITQLSVAWIPAARRWLMLYSRASPDLPREGVVCRAGKTPWNWSDETIIFDPDREGAFARYMHEPGRADRLDSRPPRGGSGWAYAPFLLVRYTRWDPQRRVATIYYLVSTSAPYQVMLMRSRLRFSDTG